MRLFAVKFFLDGVINRQNRLIASLRHRADHLLQTNLCRVVIERERFGSQVDVGVLHAGQLAHHPFHRG